MSTSFLIVAAVVFVSFLWQGRGYLAWVCGLGLLMVSCWLSGGNFLTNALILGIPAILFGVPAVRQWVLSAPIMKLASKFLPPIGKTEEIALKAGSVWWDARLFSGKPDWQELLKFKIKKLSKEEKDFLDGPVEEFCKMLDDEQVHQDRDLSPKAWKFLKEKKFLGMIIPKKYGGLGFSAIGHSAVITKIASRSIGVSINVVVPNSLGPAELLLHYGTKEQKDYYLPRLAVGKEIPCFGLTEPHAGSDAANGRSIGVVTKGTWKGKKVTGIRLTFNKRYITLAPIATVVGLAFRLHDPDHLLGDTEDIGITCALIPRDTKGLEIGNRHDPMGVPFPNGPVRGTDMFIPLEYIIGGPEYAGKGWRMLMEQLSAGRGISLPSLSMGGAQLSTRATSAYAQVRRQFGLSIGRFEGVQERLARIGSLTYKMNATRMFTCGMVDDGQNPAVASGIAKAYLTDGMRVAVNDGMDIMAGAAICRGPQNILARGYMSIPIGITVEGANILSRSMIIFGQGVIRCHPFLLKETEAIMAKDLAVFDKAFFGHINHFLCNAFRAVVLSWGGGWLADVPNVPSREQKYYRKLSRLSSCYALVVDLALATMAGDLKRKEAISGRFADGLAGLYMASAVLKQYHDDGGPKEQWPLVDYVLTQALYDIEEALAGVLRNMPFKAVGMLGYFMIFPFGGRFACLPSDKQMQAVVRAVLGRDGKVRESLTSSIYVPKDAAPGLGLLEDALAKTVAAHDIRQKVLKLRKKGEITKAPIADMARQAYAKKLISKTDLTQIEKAEVAADAAIQVDDFSTETYMNRR